MVGPPRVQVCNFIILKDDAAEVDTPRRKRNPQRFRETSPPSQIRNKMRKKREILDI